MNSPAIAVAAWLAIVAVGLSVPASAQIEHRNVKQARPAASLIASAQAKIEQRNLQGALTDLMKAGELEPSNIALQRCTATVILAIDDEAEGRPAQIGAYCSGPVK